MKWTTLLIELTLFSVSIEMGKGKSEVQKDISVLIDGYTHNTTLDYDDTVQLGTTVILVCTVTGISYGVQTSYRWTCPHGTCNIGSHILKIPLISTSDGGTYTCTVLADGINKSAVFTVTAKQPTSGFIVTSQNRILDHEAVITNITEIVGDQEIGEIQCRSYNGDNATWVRPGFILSTSTTGDVYKSENGLTASLFVKRISNTSDDYYCSNSTYKQRHYINLYLSNNTLPIPSMMMVPSGKKTLKMKMSGGTGEHKYVTRYDRLDLGVPVEVGHVEDSNQQVSLSVVPGGLYRVKVWIIRGQHISSTPNEATYRAKSSVPTKPRHLTITRVFQDGVELNWMPPSEPNGELHYTIKYGSNTTNTASNLTYYNLTGLVNGTTYNITVMAVNSAGSSTSDVMEYTYMQPALTITETPDTTGATSATSGNSNLLTVVIVAVVVVVVVLILIAVVTLIIIVVCNMRSKKKKRDIVYYNNVVPPTSKEEFGEDKPDYTYVVNKEIKLPNTGDTEEPPHYSRAERDSPVNQHYNNDQYVQDGLHYDTVDKDMTTDARTKPNLLGTSNYTYEDIDVDKNKEKSANKTDKKSKSKDDISKDASEKKTNVQPVDPSDLYAMPNKKKKKNKSKPPSEVDNPEAFYAQPDKTKKKGKGEISRKQETEQKYEPSADSDGEGEIPQVPGQDPDMLYSVVNKSKKTKK